MDYLMNTVEQYPIYIDRVEGPYIIDARGRELYDFYNDEGVVGLGYSALRDIFEDASHGRPYYIPRVFHSIDRENAAGALCRAMGYEKAFFCNSGTEAVEAAIKIARRVNWLSGSKADTIYTFKNTFHGRTYGSLTASDSTPYHKEGFGPMLPGFKHFTWPDEIDWDRCIAVLVTPAFVNHSDFLEYPSGWLQQLKHGCDSVGALFMVDEIQTGFGRCGVWKLIDRYGIQPDLICVGKGIANGLPVAGVLTTEQIASCITPGRHFSTFGGWPLGMAAVCEVIKQVAPMIESGELDDKGRFFKEKLGELGWLHHIRGYGLLTVGNVDFDAREFCEKALNHGILMATHRPWALKFSPSMILDKYQLEDVVDKLGYVYRKYFD